MPAETSRKPSLVVSRECNTWETTALNLEEWRKVSHQCRNRATVSIQSFFDSMNRGIPSSEILPVDKSVAAVLCLFDPWLTIFFPDKKLFFPKKEKNQSTVLSPHFLFLISHSSFTVPHSSSLKTQSSVLIP